MTTQQFGADVGAIVNRRVALAVAACLTLAACGGGGEDTSYGNEVKITVNTPAMIAQASADDYNQNVNGLITAATLKRWIANWTANRPAGITGKLIIFQATVGPTGAEYIKPNGTTVFTYLSPSSEWIQTRINGVIETQSMVPDGPTMDALFKKYNIDPANDMIVCAQGTGATGNAMSQGRCWYALRYWGVDKKNVSVLNGGNQWINGNGMVAADFQATASTAPNTGSVERAVASSVDNTALQATFEDVLAVVTRVRHQQEGRRRLHLGRAQRRPVQRGRTARGGQRQRLRGLRLDDLPCTGGLRLHAHLPECRLPPGTPQGNPAAPVHQPARFDQGLLVQAQGCALELHGRRS